MDTDIKRAITTGFNKRKPYLKDMSVRVCEALDIFTDEEVASLRALYENDTSEFIGIFFKNEHEEWSQFANKDKADAIAVLEEEYRKELRE